MALRPDSIADAQFAELKVQGELNERTWAHGVQVMNEGYGPRGPRDTGLTPAVPRLHLDGIYG